MSDHFNERYGMIRDVESDLLDDVLNLVKSEFKMIQFLEIGVMGAGTVRGIYRQAQAIQCPVHCEGVDFDRYNPNPRPADDYVFHSGDSMDVWRNIKGRFNLLYIDGCHCVNHAMADFLNYSPLLVVGGYALFHDTANPGKPFEYPQGEWPQDHSYAGKPPSVLGVREGLRKLGLLQNYRSDWTMVKELPCDTGLMGMILFKKLKDL